MPHSVNRRDFLRLAVADGVAFASALPGWAANRIALAPHERVRFELTAEDTPMSFSIPPFDMRVDVPPGAVVTLAVEAGRGHRAVCGSGDETMNGRDRGRLTGAPTHGSPNSRAVRRPP